MTIAAGSRPGRGNPINLELEVHQDGCELVVLRRVARADEIWSCAFVRAPGTLDRRRDVQQAIDAFLGWLDQVGAHLSAVATWAATLPATSTRAVLLATTLPIVHPRGVDADMLSVCIDMQANGGTAAFLEAGTRTSRVGILSPRFLGCPTEPLGPACDSCLSLSRWWNTDLTIAATKVLYAMVGHQLKIREEIL